MEAFGWFVSPAFAKVLEKAQKYLGANYKLQKGAQEMFEELNRNLLVCQATVMEAGKGAIINNPALESLLFHLKLDVLDAENSLDNIEAKYIKEEGQGKNKVYRLVSSFRNTFFLQAELRSLKKVGDKLKKLSTDIPTLLYLVNINKDNESHTHEVTDQRKTIFQLFESKGSGGVRCPYWPSESKESEGVRCAYWPSESKGSGGVRCPYCSSDKTQFDWESKLFDSEFPFLHSIKSEFQFSHASLPLSFLFLELCERWRKLERILTAEMVSPHSPASPPPTPMTSTASSCSASSTPPPMNTTSTGPTSPIAAASAISVSVI